MKKVIVEIECPEEYHDVADEIILDDFLACPGAWVVRLHKIEIPQDLYFGAASPEGK